MAAVVRVFPCLTDNFGLLLHDPVTRATAAIDAPEAKPIIAALDHEGWSLTDILITHHHADHVGGVAELKQRYNCRVFAPNDKRVPIANVDSRLKEGDKIKIGRLNGRVLETPGHTLDHISYVFDDEDLLFAADTLFSIGCGRVIEGNAAMMWDSLLKLRELPDSMKLFCGHEYTMANIRFAFSIEPDNEALKQRTKEVVQQITAKQPTIPSRLGDEKKANVFLRSDSPEVAAAVGMTGRSASDVFAEVRERKNNFKG